MELCLVLSARQYQFKDDQGRNVEGVTVNYLTLDSVGEEGTRGLPPLSISAPLALWPQLDTLPGYYDVDFRQRPGPKGKPTLQIVSAKLVQPLELLQEAA